MFLKRGKSLRRGMWIMRIKWKNCTGRESSGILYPQPEPGPGCG